MGCDIHLFIEVERSVNNLTAWRSRDLYVKNLYFGGEDDDVQEPEYETISAFRDRDYSLFAALAGVRDYSSDNPMVSEPKGIPDDADLPYKSKCWDSDAHTHSWNTLEELYKFQSENKTVKYSGYLSDEQSKALDAGEMPRSWCQGTNSAGYVWREWEEEADVLGALIKSIENHIERTDWIYEPRKSQEKVRILYFFDN